MTRRRAVLRSLALAGTGTFAGCGGLGGEATPTPSERVERGAAEPVSVSRTYDRGRYAYLDAQHAVRYAATNSAGTPIPTGTPAYPEQYATTPFERWGRLRTAAISAGRVATALETRFSGTIEAGSGAAPEGDEIVAYVFLTTVLDRGGRVDFTPEQDFGPVVDATPGSVDATVRLADQEYSRTVPVWVEERTIRQES
jgi:hypothetical protein